MECGSCRSIAGEIVLTNAPRLELDDHWRVEHCHPVAVAGWLVLVLRRHAPALHEATQCEHEYLMQFAEGAGFHHVHFHLVARAPDWPDQLKGPKVFAAFGAPDPISSTEATKIIEAVGAQLGVPPAATDPFGPRQ